MPVIRATTPGIRETAMRPITVTMVDDVIRFLRLKELVKDIRYLTHTGDVRMPSSAITERSNDYATFSGTDRAWVETEEIIQENNWATSRPDRYDQPPMFYDEVLDVGVTPLLQTVESVIKVRINSHARDTIEQLHRRLSIRLATVNEGLQHTSNMSAQIHPAAQRLLKEVHSKRESRRGYGDSYLDYLYKYTHDGLTHVSEASGTQIDPVIKYRLSRINGRFQVAPLPEKPSYQDNGSIWELQLEYKADYDIPAAVILTYPIMIHNQYLGEDFIGHLERETDLRDKQLRHSSTQTYTYPFEFGKVSGLNLVQDKYINIPRIDHWEPPIAPVNTATVFTALLQQDDQDSRLLLNLKELGDVYLSPELIKFMSDSEHRYMSQPYTSVFYCNLYEGSYMRGPGSLRIDKDLNVYALEPLDVREIYRLRLGLCVDTKMLSRGALDRMWDHEEAMITLLKAINTAVLRASEVFTGNARGNIQPWMVSPMWRAAWGVGHSDISQDGLRLLEKFGVPQKELNKVNAASPHMKTVQLSSIVIHRK